MMMPASSLIHTMMQRSFENDPFCKTLTRVGVGQLMEMAIEGKKVNSKLHCGICGEHGGDPTSVEFCNKIGLDYVSCSPFRVPLQDLQPRTEQLYIDKGISPQIAIQWDFPIAFEIYGEAQSDRRYLREEVGGRTSLW